MSVLQAIVLGIVQGITEFAPISSSGHLVLVPWLLGWERLGDAAMNKTFDVALHIGTLIGAVAYFRSDLRRYLVAFYASLRTRRIEGTEGRIAWALVVGTIPGAVIGAVFQGFIEERLGSPWLIAVMLVIFGVVLVVVDRRAGDRLRMEDVSLRRGLLLGIAQALALQPGVSRSGVTITAARAMGFDRPTAARVSFLLALPIIAGAGLFKAVGLIGEGIPSGTGEIFLAGMTASAVSGFLVVWFLLSYLRRHAFTAFLAYRVAVAAVVIAAIASGARPASI